MISATFDPVYDSNNNLIGNRLTVWFNSKIVTQFDYPAEASMSQDDLDNYIVGKLSGILA